MSKLDIYTTKDFPRGCVLLEDVREIQKENGKFLGYITQQDDLIEELESQVQTKDALTKELEGEVENRKAQVHWKCIEIEKLEKRNKTLTAKIELLTRCEKRCLGGWVHWDEMDKTRCQGCKNKQQLENMEKEG